MASPFAIDQRVPTHRVQHYQSWRLAYGGDEPSDLIWTSGGHGADQRHRFLPFVEPSLILRLRGDVGARPEADLLIGSACLQGGWHRPRRDERLIGLRLPPELCAPALGISPRDYCDIEPQPAPPAFKRTFAPLLRRARQLSVPAIAAALYEGLGRMNAERPQRNVHLAVHQMRLSEGRLGCADLARQLDLTDRQLRRLFADEVGMSPKAYGKRLRFAAAMIAAEQPRSSGWADIAAAFGYADQAHLIRDSRDLTGVSPERLRRERLGDVRFVQ